MEKESIEKSEMTSVSSTKKSDFDTPTEFKNWVGIQMKEFDDVPFKCLKCNKESETDIKISKCPHCGYSPGSSRLSQLFAGSFILIGTVAGGIVIGSIVATFYSRNDISREVFFLIELLILASIIGIGKSSLKTIGKSINPLSGSKLIRIGTKYHSKGQDFDLQSMQYVSMGIFEYGPLFRDDHSLFPVHNFCGYLTSNILPGYRNSEQLHKLKYIAFRDILFGEIILRYLFQPELNEFDQKGYRETMKYLSYDKSKVIEIAKIIANNHPDLLNSTRIRHIVETISENAPSIASILSPK